MNVEKYLESVPVGEDNSLENSQGSHDVVNKHLQHVPANWEKFSDETPYQGSSNVNKFIINGDLENATTVEKGTFPETSTEGYDEKNSDKHVQNVPVKNKKDSFAEAANEFIVDIPEMSIVQSDDEDDDNHFFKVDEIVPGPNISESPYRYFLMFSGLIGSPLAPLNSVRYILQRIFIFVFIICFLFLKFGAILKLNVLVIEEKFPFTIANNVIWELRWIVTFLLTMNLMRRNCLQSFLRSVRISQRKWHKNRGVMRRYIAAVFLITVIAPCSFVLLDLNYLNVSTLEQRNNTILSSVIFSLLVFLYRMIVVPCFCVLSAMLYLLGDHIRHVGKEMYLQKSCKDASNLVGRMRKFVRFTEKTTQNIIMVHMILIFCISFTSAMSTLERLEFTYKNTKDGNNKTLRTMEVHIADLKTSSFPINDLVNLKSNVDEMQKHLILMNSSKSNDGNENGFNQDHLLTAQQLFSKVQQQYVQLLENYLIQNKNQPRNVSVRTTSSNDDSSKLYNVIFSINDSYTKLRVLLDSFMTLIEILLLYMSPLYLIIRTDYMLRDTIGDVWDINIDEQQENNLAITTYGAKEHILDHVKDTDGFRVYGYKVDFFKTLLLASFGPFFAIALRATWKHFGLF